MRISMAGRSLSGSWLIQLFRGIAARGRNRHGTRHFHIPLGHTCDGGIRVLKRMRGKRSAQFFFLCLSLLMYSGCVWLPLNRSHREAQTYRVSAVHEVQEGETLEQIADEFGTTPLELATYNRLSSLETPPPGTELRMPPRLVPASLLRESWLRAKQNASSLIKETRLWHPRDTSTAESENRESKETGRLTPMPYSHRVQGAGVFRN
ncbi:MAG: LysM domain-containing protein [Candidatus Hydrogenedentota bacterium]|nr:MAG: LysM domain-containing protein [Candidatus Hydrogenedentota bacterium]